MPQFINKSFQIGLDPAGTKFMFDVTAPYIQSGDAEYVQIIHTSALGMIRNTADADIYIKYDSPIRSGIINLHSLAVYIHIAIATKRLFIIAEESGRSTMIVNTGTPPRAANKTECLMGIYGKLDQRKQYKTYQVTFTSQKQVETFWESLGEYGSEYLFGSVSLI